MKGADQIIAGYFNGEWPYLISYFFVCALLLVLTLAGLVVAKRTLFPSKSKKLSIRVIKGARTDVYGGKSTHLSVKNIGKEDIGIHHYGYRNWKGVGINQERTSVFSDGEILKPEQKPIELTFYDGVEGRNIQFEEKDILFYFVETGDKVFRQYTIWKPLGWVIRKLRRC